MLSRSHRTKGFTLIEVLIALFVLAIGLLGMATLMMASMQSSQGASQRSAATVAAYDLAERMRANRTQAGVAASPYAGNPADSQLPECFTDINNTAGCSAADNVQLDRAQWLLNLRGTVPDAEATIQQLDNTTFCMVIFWRDSGTELINEATPCGIDADDRAFYTMQVSL